MRACVSWNEAEEEGSCVNEQPAPHLCVLCPLFFLSCRGGMSKSDVHGSGRKRNRAQRAYDDDEEYVAPAPKVKVNELIVLFIFLCVFCSECTACI